MMEAARMAENFVGKISDFQEGDRRIVFVGDNEIGVFRDGGEFHAYSNFCLHQGGPACEGLTIAKVEERTWCRTRRLAGSISPTLRCISCVRGMATNTT